MYAVKVNNDTTVTKVVEQEIFVNYKLADWFYVFTNQYVNGEDFSNIKGFIEYKSPQSNKVITEALSLKHEMYNENYKFVLSSNSDITNETGVVKAKFIFKKGSFVVLTSATIDIKILSEKEYHDDGTTVPTPSSNIDIDKIMEKIRPLTYSSISEAETDLNSGNVKDIYLGQSVIILNNGRYELYTVQKDNSTDMYIVEPVDLNNGGGGSGDDSNILWWDD